MASLQDIDQDTGLSVGQNGARYVSTLATSISGVFGAIQATEDAVFTSITASNWTGDSPANLKLPAGASIFGEFTAFTLTSGKVLAYNK
jgi:hypothetical protein